MINAEEFKTAEYAEERGVKRRKDREQRGMKNEKRGKKNEERKEKREERVMRSVVTARILPILLFSLFISHFSFAMDFGLLILGF